MNANTGGTRRDDLAKIHIARKALDLDDEVYRDIIRSVGKAASGSSADLSPTGRARVLTHFAKCGWSPRRRANADGVVVASEHQVRLIGELWAALADVGLVQDRSEAALRRWVESASRRYHAKRVGWAAPEFLPSWVASRVIEHLKRWQARKGGA